MVLRRLGAARVDTARWKADDPLPAGATPAGDDDARRSPIRLAQEAPFRLGPLMVEPALRRVASIDGRGETIQPRVMQALVALAQAGGEILSRDDLLARCWHGLVVGEDSIDRVIARLRRLVDLLAPDELQLETIPRVGYRMLAAQAAEAPLPPPAAPLALEGATVLAVLPFDNLSGDPDFRYFADGVSEEILLTVAKTTGMTVIGRASSFQFRGRDRSARDVATALGATHVLDGAVRRSGDRLRISAQLVDCESQTLLWSDRFDRRLADVFALQDEIAAEVAAALKAQFAPSRAQGPIDPAAYDLYLRARDRNPEMMGFETGPLEEAVARAPSFVQAWALLAYARGIMLHFAPTADDRAQVLRAADTALNLDPQAAYAHLALELAEPICGRFAERQAMVNRALETAPNDPLVLVHAAGLHDVLGHQRRAVEFIERAYRLDPRRAAFYYPCLLETVGRRDEALAAIARDTERWPDSIALHTVAARFAFEDGDWQTFDRQLPYLDEAPGGGLLPAMMLRAAEPFRTWSPATARALLDELSAEVTMTGTLSLGRLGLLVREGYVDEVYGLIERASFDRLHTPEGRLPMGELSLNVLFTPLFASLRRDVRFVDLCARLGLTHYWVESGQWPDFAAEVADRYNLMAEARWRRG